MLEAWRSLGLGPERDADGWRLGLIPASTRPVVEVDLEERTEAEASEPISNWPMRSGVGNQLISAAEQITILKWNRSRVPRSLDIGRAREIEGCGYRQGVWIPRKIEKGLKKKGGLGSTLPRPR